MPLHFLNRDDRESTVRIGIVIHLFHKQHNSVRIMMTEDGKSSPEFLDILYSYANEEDEEIRVPQNKRPSCSRCR